MSTHDPLLMLLARFRDEGVEYVLIGGQAVRINGYVRATEDIDVLVKATRVNGEKIIRALSFLDAPVGPQSPFRMMQVVVPCA